MSFPTRHLVTLAGCIALPFSGFAATFTVTSLDDTSTPGTLRWAINQANSEAGSTINFATSGIITIGSPLPAIGVRVAIDGTTAPGFRQAPIVEVDFAGQPGLTIQKTAKRTEVRALSLVRAQDAALTLRANEVTIAGNYIGLSANGASKPNGGDGVKILSPSKRNVIGSSVNSSNSGGKSSFQLSNVISGNRGNGIGLYGSTGNVISQNFIGTNPAGTRAIGNRKNGILLANGASGNLIGGPDGAGNNPTGSEGKVTPVFVVPPEGNLISGNKLRGVYILHTSSNNTLSGNFIGTDRTGNRAVGNGSDGVGIRGTNGNSLIGCTVNDNPFVYYNVISGNGRDGIRLRNADNVTVQANFVGIGARNNRLVPNRGNGLNVIGSSRDTQVGGVIPLGNVMSGNTKNGIAVQDSASGFISFNTFGGGFAFGGAAPNGENGILVTSTGGNNVIRTCILSGNLGNGVEIGGDASGVQITDTACGTNTDLSAPLANQGHGVLLSGTAHGNAIGGFQPSVETRTHLSGNVGYGIAITGEAYDNVVFNSNVGLGFAVTDGLEPTIPNQTGGIYLGPGTSGTTIGGNDLIFRNKLSTNSGGGLTIDTSRENLVLGNEINDNTAFGLFATGPCNGTIISGNTITGNGTMPSDNVDVSTATGLVFVP